jgi:hypothetical protein
MAFCLDGIYHGFIDMDGVIIHNDDARRAAIKPQCRQKPNAESVQGVRGFKVTFFNSCTWQQTIDRHGWKSKVFSAYAPCTAAIDVRWVANIMSNWTVGTIPPFRLLVEYRFIEKDEILRDIVAHLLPSLSSKVIAACQRYAPRLPLCPFPPLQGSGHRRPVNEHPSLHQSQNTISS